MILECGDLERALRTPELMPDMRAHAEQCAACNEQLHLWTEISRLAPGLHEEWDSPFLWYGVRGRRLAAEPARHRAVQWAPWLRWALAVAGVILLAAAMLQPWQKGKSPNREFLTESALQEVQQAEKAYARSIEKLSAVASQNLDRSSSSRKTDSAGFGNCGVEGHGREQPLQHILADRAGFALPPETTDTPGMVTECDHY